jgi:hypothetical protein
LEGEAYPDQSWGVNWHATSPTGQFGPLLVEASSPTTSYGRKLTITETSDATPGVLFEDRGTYSSGYPYYQRVSVDWQTNYDSSKLQLRMYRHRPGWTDDELLWSQTESTLHVGWKMISCYPYMQSPDSLVFRLVVVPEPSSIVVLSAGMLFAVGAVMRRSRR